MNCLWVNWFLGRFLHFFLSPSEGPERFTESQAQLLFYVPRTQRASPTHSQSAVRWDAFPSFWCLLPSTVGRASNGPTWTIAPQWACSVASPWRLGEAGRS